MDINPDDYVAVAEVSFRVTDQTRGPDSPKKSVSRYLREQFPTARIRRVLLGMNDATILVVQPISSDVRNDLNAFVTVMDATPYLLSNKTRLGTVRFKNERGSDDSMLFWALAEDSAHRMLAEIEDMGAELLDEIEIFEVEPVYLMTFAVAEGKSVFTAVSGMKQAGIALKTVFV